MNKCIIAFMNLWHDDVIAAEISIQQIPQCCTSLVSYTKVIVRQFFTTFVRTCLVQNIHLLLTKNYIVAGRERVTLDSLGHHSTGTY